MKRFLLLPVFFTLVLCPVFAYRLWYAEQLYELYHRQLYQDSDAAMENIVWLEEALKAPFSNPLYALAKIKNDTEWKHYRYLFKMHVNLLLVKQYLIFAYRYNKQVAYFYNAPWKEQNLESLETAEQLFEIALFYWEEAVVWSNKLYGSPHHLTEIQLWEDESYRIQTGDLDYRDIIQGHIGSLEQVRKIFQDMDQDTY